MALISNHGNHDCFPGVLLVCMFSFSPAASPKTLWLPFYESMRKIVGRLTGPGQDSVKKNISRARSANNELNEALTRMIRQIHHDYKSLKEFSENAPRIQTPLALITARVEQQSNLKIFRGTGPLDTGNLSFVPGRRPACRKACCCFPGMRTGSLRRFRKSTLPGF